MKKAKLLAGIVATGVLSLGASASFAQSEAWKGFSVQAGVGVADFSPGFSGGKYLNAYPYTATKDDLVTAVGTVTAGYTFALSGPWTLGIAAGIIPGTSSSASYTVLTTTPLGVSQSPGTYSISNYYSISLQPGFAIDSEKLIYAKAGFTGTTANTNSAAFGTATSTLNGYVIGLGYKQIITGGLYGYAEINYAKYGNVNVPYSALSGTINASAVDGYIGIGWRF